MPPAASEQAFLASLDELTCPICQEPFDSNRKHHPVSIDGCRHIFGASCLTTWVKSSSRNRNTCPTCRAVLFETPARIRATGRTSRVLLRRRSEREYHTYFTEVASVLVVESRDAQRSGLDEGHREQQRRRQEQHHMRESEEQTHQAQLAWASQRRRAYRALTANIVSGGGEEGIMYQFLSHTVLKIAREVEAEIWNTMV